jgi:hypothetical protein
MTTSIQLKHRTSIDSSSSSSSSKRSRQSSAEEMNEFEIDQPGDSNTNTLTSSRSQPFQSVCESGFSCNVPPMQQYSSSSSSVIRSTAANTRTSRPPPHIFTPKSLHPDVRIMVVDDSEINKKLFCRLLALVSRT